MVSSAVFASWSFDPGVLALLLLSALTYLRGWLKGRRIMRDERDTKRLAAFVAGLVVLYLAIESPLDAFDTLSLSAHMAQHLLLMMIAPPLLLMSRPMLPFLRGLPRGFVKEGLGPFLAWPVFQRFLHLLTFPVCAWLLYNASTIFWHLPKFYDLVLRSPGFHAAQHACFFWSAIVFWWPVIEPGPGRSPWPRWAMIPYLLLADIANTALSAFFIFSDETLYPAYQAVRVLNMSAHDDQVLAGLIMWVPGSLAYLAPAIAVAMSVFASERKFVRTTVAKSVTVAKSRQRSRIWRHAPQLRRCAQALLAVLALIVILDGFLGPQIAPLNLAGVLPWIHWRALSLFALLIVGNLFCMACPFTFARDIARRVLPPKLRWPRQLRSKWLPICLFAFYLWAYEAFSLWNSPWLTAWIISGYFLAALLIDTVFRGASFCKYVCPIGQFHFISSLVSPSEIRIREKQTCQSCKTHDCIRGNDQVRGCELYLFQPKKAGNLDCTFCLDCVQACPHDNVALLPVAPASTLLNDPYRSGIGRLSRRTDIVVLALVIIFGAFVNAGGMTAPVTMWEHRWHAVLGTQAMPWIVAGVTLAGLLLVPAVLVSLCAAANRLAGANAQAVRRFALALVPVGFAMWAAHLLYHFATSWSAAIPAVERALSQLVVTPPAFALPWLMPAQLLLLDAGLLLTLYVSWRIAKQYARRISQSLALMVPWAAVAGALYVVGVWVLLQPMQMRGMLH